MKLMRLFFWTVFAACTVPFALAAGNLKVTLSPAAAVSAGAQWRIDGGAWQASGATVKSLANGNHTVDYKPVASWFAPAAHTVNIGGGTTSVTNTYSAAAALKVTLTPATGAWRVDGGAWQSSGATVGNLTAGSHAVAYGALSGYTAPANENVALTAGQTTQLARTYAPQTGQIFVSTVPGTATSTGAAHWRIDGGAWNSCGVAVTAPVGSHTLEFQPTAGWIVPASSSITVSQNSQLALTANYFYAHRLRFFLNQNLTAGLDTATIQARIAQYVGHIQTIFHRETLRRFTFNPATDITICTADPFSGGFTGTLPEIGFEVWAYASLTDQPAYGSYGGNGTFDQSGAGGATNLRWDQIYDPSALTDNSPQLDQYWHQINNLVHELEHTFGAGLGEYYSIGSVTDLSGVEPSLPPMVGLNSIDSHPFWDTHPEYWTDPLTMSAYANPRLGSPVSLAALLSTVRFAPATVGVNNGLHRLGNADTGMSTLPNLGAVEVSVVDATTGQLIPGATLRVWNRRNPGTFGYFENTVTATSTPGLWKFKWEPYPESNPLNNWDNAKILKAYAPGYSAKAQLEWVYDAQRTKAFYGQSVHQITIRLTAGP